MEDLTDLGSDAVGSDGAELAASPADASGSDACFGPFELEGFAAAPSATRGGGILATDPVTFGPTGCSTARSDGTHGGGVKGSFGCLGRGFALGGSPGDGVWV